MPDVLVAGGGPTGLMAAFELERAGLDVLVLERDARPTTQSKALALQPRSVEVLDDRGLLAAIEPYVAGAAARRALLGHPDRLRRPADALPVPARRRAGARGGGDRGAAAHAGAARRGRHRRGAGRRGRHRHRGRARPPGGVARRGRRRAQHGPHAAGRRVPRHARRGSRWSSPTSRSPRKPAGLADDWRLPSPSRGSCCRSPAGATARSSAARSSSGSAATRPSRPTRCSAR